MKPTFNSLTFDERISCPNALECDETSRLNIRKALGLNWVTRTLEASNPPLQVDQGKSYLITADFGACGSFGDTLYETRLILVNGGSENRILAQPEHVHKETTKATWVLHCEIPAQAELTLITLSAFVGGFNWMPAFPDDPQVVCCTWSFNPILQHKALVAVPDVVGFTELDASGKIADADLSLDPNIPEAYANQTAGLVASQAPVAGSLVAVGSLVSIVLSLGQPVVPNVLGMLDPDATAAINAVGLCPHGYSVVPSTAALTNRVVLQSPVGGTVVPASSGVDITFGSGPSAEVLLAVGLDVGFYYPPNHLVGDGYMMLSGSGVGSITPGHQFYFWFDTTGLGEGDVPVPANTTRININLAGPLNGPTPGGVVVDEMIRMAGLTPGFTDEWVIYRSTEQTVRFTAVTSGVRSPGISQDRLPTTDQPGEQLNQAEIIVITPGVG